MNSSEDFSKSGYNLAVPTKVIVHGFLSSTAEPVFQLNKDGNDDIFDLLNYINKRILDTRFGIVHM